MLQSFNVARIERSEIRGRIETGSPDFAALYPGYNPCLRFPLNLPARLNYIRQLTDQGKYTAQLPDIGNFQCQPHPGDAVAFVG